jgi:hypothetical protein
MHAHPSRFIRFGHDSREFMLATVSDDTDLVQLVQGFPAVASALHAKIERCVALAAAALPPVAL